MTRNETLLNVLVSLPQGTGWLILRRVVFLVPRRQKPAARCRLSICSNVGYADRSQPKRRALAS